MNQDLLKKLEMIPFQPLPLLFNGKAQTIAAYYLPYNPYLLNTFEHIITLPDDDKLVIVENRPQVWRSSRRVILLIHGLTGSHQSKYIVRMTRLFLSQGYVIIRMNLRGCGAGAGLAKKLYHSGRSEDTRAVLQWLSNYYPDSPVTQIGFSLGGNITLKMAGEDGTSSSGNLDSVAAISPPLDLESSVKLIIKKQNYLFNQHFIQGLINDIEKIKSVFPEMTIPKIPSNINMLEFDDLFTAPQSGFKNARDYYTQCSSYQFLENIALPTFILYAMDDPLITRRKFFKLPQKDNFDVIITRKGGHVGWLGKTNEPYQYRWMDKVVNRWVNWFDGRFQV